MDQNHSPATNSLLCEETADKKRNALAKYLKIILYLSFLSAFCFAGSFFAFLHAWQSPLGLRFTATVQSLSQHNRHMRLSL